MNFIFFIGVLVFSCFWTWFTNKFLPAETLEKINHNHDMMKDKVKCL